MDVIEHYEAPPSPLRRLSPDRDPDIIQRELWFAHPDGRVACVQSWGETETDIIRRARLTLAEFADGHTLDGHKGRSQAAWDRKDAAAALWQPHAHRFAANPGMYDSLIRYCEVCGVAESVRPS